MRLAPQCSFSDLASVDLVRNCPYLQKLKGYGNGISAAIDDVELSSIPVSTIRFQS